MAECSEDQLAVFDEMHKRNMYPTKPAQGQEIQTARQSMQQLRNETW